MPIGKFVSEGYSLFSNSSSFVSLMKVPESHLSSLKALSLQFEVSMLVKQCEEMMERFKLNKKLFDSGKSVEISYQSSRLNCCTVFLNKLPIDVKKLTSFRLTGDYSDVDIYIEGHGQVARVHRIILGLWSAPFTKMFTNGMTESVSSKVCLKDVCFDAFNIMLEFMYSGEVNKEDTMDIDTLLLQLLLLADQFGVSLLHQECCKRLLEHLSEHPDLTVTSEERVLNAILIWCCKAEELFGWDRVDDMMLNSTPELVFSERLNLLGEFLSFVRFPLLPYPMLQKLERSNLTTRFPKFNQLVKEAISFLEFGSSGHEKDINKFQHRRSSFKELQYICDGDSNGVLYFAGTSYGEHQWVNPVLSKKVTIAPSSPLSRFTDPKVLVSRSYQGTSYAGPRMEDGRTTSWWMVDIGHGHQLMCNYYTLRQDGSRAFIRHWNFQGSMDGNNWTNLRAHENDETMCKPGQYASWPVVGPNALLPFRFFRVVLTAPTTDTTNPWSFCICFSFTVTSVDTTNPWSFCICFLELYGYFR
ncbi:UNVERIFIED_CONTAM: BTB/POZ domain-containing protein [Sesamum radiatum]|uniref:BTB/POZ domain-containing protein n=1 Tax=Sesamum radiatum TaxID=300843 RepID=A0AAW2SKQ3_SESRA